MTRQTHHIWCLKRPNPPQIQKHPGRTPLPPLGRGPRSPHKFRTTVERTVGCYRQVQEGAGSALQWCQADLAPYQKVPSP
jgi:hypothetical protein